MAGDGSDNWGWEEIVEFGFSGTDAAPVDEHSYTGVKSEGDTR